MRSLSYEFLVKEVVIDDSGPIRAIGRNGDFPVRIGDTFDRVYRYLPRKYPEEAGRKPVRGPEAVVSLRVTFIEAYGRSLAELGEGMTGSISVEGEGANVVDVGTHLGTFDDAPPRKARPIDSAKEMSFIHTDQHLHVADAVIREDIARVES